MYAKHTQPVVLVYTVNT